MENIVLAALLTRCLHLDPFDWRTWMIGWGICGALAGLF